MKDNFGDTFDASRRFAGVSMSQGEVASDNDWNAGDGAETGTPPAGGDTGEDSVPDLEHLRVGVGSFRCNTDQVRCADL